MLEQMFAFFGGLWYHKAKLKLMEAQGELLQMVVF
jgi:hypothetical protein